MHSKMQRKVPEHRHGSPPDRQGGVSSKLCLICLITREISIVIWLTMVYDRYIILFWLVVYLPLWKIMEWTSVGMMTFPTEWKNKKCSKPSTSIFIFSSTNWLSTQETCGILILVINDGGGNQCYWVDKVTRTPFLLRYEVNMR